MSIKARIDLYICPDCDDSNDRNNCPACKGRGIISVVDIISQSHQQQNPLIFSAIPRLRKELATFASRLLGGLS